MAQCKNIRIGPIALTTTMTTNLVTPGAVAGGTNAGGTPNCYLIIHHIRVVNKTGSAATFSLWLGATGANAAGTEVIGQGLSVPANSYVDWYGRLVLDVGDFLVGGAGTATALSFEAEAELGIR